MILNISRIEAIKENGSYFSSGQVQVLNELGDYIKERQELPTTEKLAAYSTRSEIDVRRDLMSVSLQGFLWVFGVEA